MELFNEDITPQKTLGDIVNLNNVVSNQSIVNGSFQGGQISIGSGEDIFKANRQGIYLGSSSFETAPFSVDMQGNLIASSATIAGDIVSSNYNGTAPYAGYKLEYSTGDGYFNQIKIRGGSNSYFISDTIDTQAKSILKDFSFSDTDYSGAFKTGDITWNTTTGAITGGSGGLFNKGGLVFAYNGTPTITLNGTTGEATFSGNVTGATITGGMFQTNSSDKRIRIVSQASTSPTQAANSLALISSSGNDILNFGSEASLIMAIKPDDDNAGFFVQAKDGLTYTKSLLSSSILDSDSTGIAGNFENNGTGDCVYIQEDSTGIGLHISTAGTTASTTDLIRINNYKGGDTIKIIKDSTTSGRCIFIDQNNTTNTYQPLYITNAGTGGSEIVQESSAAGTFPALSLTMNNGVTACLSLQQNAVISTNFKKIALFGTVTIWISNGTSPNGNLSGYIGDICFGCDGGKAYYLSTYPSTWTAM